MLSDQQFLREFEQTCLDPANFNHLGHIRIAWLYLNQYPTQLATDKIANGIKRYAASLGAPDKFHMTMTGALARIIAKRLELHPDSDWHQFVQINQDLIRDAKRLVSHYYSQSLIESELARTEFLKPDKQSFQDA